jgi:uncharacterized protein YndB with AHSA1/START domain
MIATKETIYEKDVANKQMHVVREFDAPVEEVFKAWTTPELLDQWWAPKPWTANTVSMDFREGGSWFYYMQGPDGERHYCRADFSTIKPGKSFGWKDAFTDDKGNVNKDMPSTEWNCVFSKSGNGTQVECTLTYTSEADMNRIIEMGFKEGFAMAHKNLDELLAQ